MQTVLQIKAISARLQADRMEKVAKIAHMNAGIHQKKYNIAKLVLQRREKELKLAIKKEYDTALQAVQSEIIARSAAEATLR